MSVAMQVDYAHPLRCTLTHDPSGMSIVTDAPVDNLGQGQSFSPTDLMTISLASCMLTTMGIVAQKNNFTLQHAHASVLKEMGSEPYRYIARIVIRIQIKQSITQEQQQLLQQAAIHCPVSKSMSEQTKVDLQIDFLSA